MVKIDSVKFGEIDIDGKTYYSDVAVWWDGRVELISKEHRFNMDRLALLTKKGPEIIVVGTGMQGIVRVLPEVIQTCEDGKIRLYSDPTEKAIDVFNGLFLQGKKVAGLFHITC